MRIKIQSALGRSSLIPLLLLLCVATLLTWSTMAFFQQSSPLGGKPAGRNGATSTSLSLQERNPQQAPPSEKELEMQHEQEKARKKQEYENTKKLADQLLKTAQELKDSIDKAGENTLPSNAIRKVDEIESLSKKIRSKLKGLG